MDWLPWTIPISKFTGKEKNQNWRTFDYLTQSTTLLYIYGFLIGKIHLNSQKHVIWLKV